MNKLAKWILVVIAVIVVCTAMADAARWKFRPIGRGYENQDHPEWGVYEGNGWLTVYPTINCNKQDPNLFDKQYVYWEEEQEGSIPRGKGYNDYTAYFEWDFGCNNKVWYKLYVCPDGELKPELLPKWIDDELPPDELISLPSLGDPTGADPNIYIAVNLRLWRDNPAPPPQETYLIDNGVSDVLPGYRIGTTPFKYKEGEPCHPFVTDNLFTGTLYRHADLGFERTVIPTVSEWGLIAMAVLLLSVGAIVIWQRRQVTA